MNEINAVDLAFIVETVTKCIDPEGAKLRDRSGDRGQGRKHREQHRETRRDRQHESPHRHLERTA